MAVIENPGNDGVVIDADSHIYETRRMWLEHSPARDADLCLRIEDDENGYSWLTFGGRRIEVLGIHDPGDIAQSGTFRTRMLEGQPPEIAYDDMPATFHDPVARLGALDEFGIDQSILFPNCGIMWERALSEDLAATKVNMAATCSCSAAIGPIPKGCDVRSSISRNRVA